MTTRLQETFAKRAASKQKVLVAYLCVGDPSADESIDLALACVEAGADVLELGVPFSDPTADGPAIARASLRSIAAGGGLSATLAAAAKIRARSGVPIVLFGYYNPLFVRGDVRVVKDAAEAGVDALLIVDLPQDEGAELRAEAAAHGVAIIPLVAPTTAPSRIDALKATKPAAPFVYYVSVTGVTGSQEAPLVRASEEAAAVKAKLGAPIVVGFGVDGPAKARDAAKHTDGVVVGTAIVKAIEDGADAAARRSAVSGLVRSLRAGLDA